MTWVERVIVDALRRSRETAAHKAAEAARDYDDEEACRLRHPSSR